MSDHNTLLERVRKLLAKAEDPGVTEAEAETYNTKAAELIARYGIDRAMLAATDATTDEITSVRVDIEKPYSHDKAVLLNQIAIPLRCKAVQYTSGKSVYKVMLVGYQSDLDRVQLLYTSLLLQATTQLARVRPESWYGRESTAAYRRTWFAGFSNAVYRRLTEAEQRATNEHTTTTGQSTALVLRDRTTLVERAYRDLFPNTRKGRARRLSGSGYHDGHTAGQRANLNTTGIGGNRTALTSH